MPGVDATTVADSISAYNSWVSEADYGDESWRIQRRDQATLVALCQATPRVISMLEAHYSTVRHTEAALTLDQFGYCDWSVGASRIPDGLVNAPPMWQMIMCVSPDAVEEFA